MSSDPERTVSSHSTRPSPFGRGGSGYVRLGAYIVMHVVKLEQKHFNCFAANLQLYFHESSKRR